MGYSDTRGFADCRSMLTLSAAGQPGDKCVGGDFTTASDMGAISPAERPILDILSRPEIGPQARLAALREAGLVPPADGYEVRTLELADVEMMPIPHVPVVPHAAPLVHLDPNTPVKRGYKSGRSWIQATDATFSTKGDPSYIRLPSSPQYDPYLFIFFDDRPVDQQCIATLDMRVYRGTVRIMATDNLYSFGSVEHRVSHEVTGGARVRVTVDVKCKGMLTPGLGVVAGYGLVHIERTPDNPESGFYWYGVDLNLRPS
jgi:hypothetical protein